MHDILDTKVHVQFHDPVLIYVTEIILINDTYVAVSVVIIHAVLGKFYSYIRQ